MARKYIKTIIMVEGSESETDYIINKWLEEKYEQVGKTIANFEMLDISLTHSVETQNTSAHILALIIYTELRL
jgi:hypothetical protein